MPDYKEMYLIMTRASEQAMNILIDAQRKCEELYVRDEPPSGSLLTLLHTDPSDRE